MKSPHLIFLRHSKLILPFRDHSEMPFETLSQLGTGELNPPIDAGETARRIQNLSNVIRFGSVRVIHASPSQRCQDTARVLMVRCEKDGTTPEMKSDARLREVAFDLITLDKKEPFADDFKTNGIAAVNTAVFKGMLSGAAEPIENIYQRVDEFFKSLPQDDELRLVIAHDFFMRVVEIFIKRNGAAFAPVSLDELEATRRNGYLCGFATDKNFKTFTAIETT